jgi:2-iminobutanoate/2-iminopropanoate deaminase
MKKGITAILAGLLFTSCFTANRSLVVVNSKDAPQAIGPYSQAIRSGRLVFCSGQIGLSPVSNSLAGSDIRTQTRQALNNLKAVLEQAGSDMAHVMKVTVYLVDLNDYATVNDIYKDYFIATRPARAAVQVARLPKDALIEIECIATTK